MKLFRMDNWLRTPADRDVIAKWTVGATGAAGASQEGGAAQPQTYRLAVPPVEGDSWEFVALGDTGDSDASGPMISPQDAVAQNMAADCALPGKPGRAAMIVHTGDVIYMTGEKRLYDRNFRRPYSDFLIPESTIDNLVFKMPFLPVPGNHDYYDLGGWAMWLARIPFFGSGLKALTRRLFAFNVPENGSDSGRVYMEAFVDLKADTSAGPLPYVPGTQTRLPNRYYRFERGGVDFFALDSNTLDAPPPSANNGQVREDAAQRIAVLEKKSDALDTELRRHQRALETWQEEQRAAAATDPERRTALVERTAAVVAAFGALKTALRAISVGTDTPAAFAACQTKAVDAVTTAERRWLEGAADLGAASAPQEGEPDDLAVTDGLAKVRAALADLETASDEACAALSAVESCLGGLPEGAERTAILGAQTDVNRELDQWTALSTPAPIELTARLKALSEETLDVQRELTLERRRLRYRPEDHDAAQIRWLDEALAASQSERPNAWRIVYLHHPLYTTIGNHCERPDVTDLRDNLLSVLKDRVDLVISGHSHAFEWFRSDALPHTGLFVTGGGGQISLRPSILMSARFARNQESYQALRAAGVREYAMAGLGPAATEDGEAGSIYHYLRVEVTPDALRVRPVGVRRLESGGFRREEPMPAYHAAELPAAARPRMEARRLESVEIRRGQTPRARWLQK